MNRPPAPSSIRNRTSGTTLIEVLAGLLILGTLLVSVLIARGRFAAQMAQADHRAAAVRALDAQLTTWLSGPPQNIPVGREGALADLPGTFWRTRVRREASADRLNAIVLNVLVFDRKAGALHQQPLFTVEILLHDERKPEAE
jgi:hypothetical protein